MSFSFNFINNIEGEWTKTSIDYSKYRSRSNTKLIYVTRLIISSRAIHQIVDHDFGKRGFNRPVLDTRASQGLHSATSTKQRRTGKIQQEDSHHHTAAGSHNRGIEDNRDSKQIMGNSDANVDRQIINKILMKFAHFLDSIYLSIVSSSTRVSSLEQADFINTCVYTLKTQLSFIGTGW